MSETIALDFYLDASCRWSWWASIWLRRVARERPIAITWKIFSLAVQDNPEDYSTGRTHHVRDFDLHRALFAARQAGGNAALERLYTEYGNVIHAENGHIREAAVQAECLSAAGLPADLFEQAQLDPATEAGVIAETRDALSMGAVGTPLLVLAASDACLFGPVLGAVPSGAEALALWDGVYFGLQHPYLYELKRNRDRGTPAGTRAD